MTTNLRKKMMLGAMVALLATGGGALIAGIPMHMDNLKHALGWDDVTLMVVEKDASGRPTLERSTNKENIMERVTVYRSNGKKASLSFSVVSKATGKTLYFGKKDWVENGDLESIYVKDDTYNKKGEPLKGWIAEKHYQKGRMVMDVNKSYSDGSGDWEALHRHTAKYYEDGHMKELSTEKPHGNHTDVKKETWSAGHNASGGHGKDSETNTKRAITLGAPGNNPDEK